MAKNTKEKREKNTLETTDTNVEKEVAIKGNKTEENKTEENKTEENKAEENKAEDNKVDENKTVAEEEEEKRKDKDEDKKEKTSHSKKGIIWLIIFILLVVVTALYILGVNFYSSHFLVNTYINQIDCSNMDEDTVAANIEKMIDDYSLTIYGRDESLESGVEIGRISAKDIDMQFIDTKKEVSELLNRQNKYLWPISYMKKEVSSINLIQGVVYDEELLSDKLNSIDAFKKNKMIQPADAYLSDYSDDVGGYTIVAETKGTALDMEKVRDVLDAAIVAESDEVDLEECYIEAKVKADDKTLIKNCDMLNCWLGTEVIYDWNATKVVVGKEEVKQWILFENGSPMLDEAAVKEFIDSTSSELDTYGKMRSFTTITGVELSLRNGSYGWRVDRETELENLVSYIKEGKRINTEPEYSCRAYAKGKNDIGNSYVEIDLSNQHLYLYMKGEIVLESDFVSGDMSVGNTTPAGVFGITYKTTDAILRGGDYETPVKYWMPFYGNYGMHDATWRNEFGGDIYLTNGSHGCVNLPLDKAAEIYEYMKTGFPVVCYYY